MEAWNKETEPYRDRLGDIAETLNDYTERISQLPTGPLSFVPSESGALKYQLCLLTIGVGRSAQELNSSIHLLYTCGRFLAASLNIRLLIELWGVLAYAQDKVLKKIEHETTENLKIASDRMIRLMLGSKSGVPLPAGLQGTYPVINVMEFIRAADAIAPGVQETYNFLSDSAHPTYAQHSFLLFSGLDYDNWSNKTFASAAHLILDRMVSAAERAMAGIREVGLVIFDRCLPQILAESSAASGR